MEICISSASLWIHVVMFMAHIRYRYVSWLLQIKSDMLIMVLVSTIPNEKRKITET